MKIKMLGVFLFGLVVSIGLAIGASAVESLLDQEVPIRRPATDEERISAALMAKRGPKPETLSVAITANDGQYATGSVISDVREDSDRIWLAAHVDSEWQIVWEGKDIVPCESLIGYETVPETLIPKCYNESLGLVVGR